MRINHNLQALNTYRQMGINSGSQAKSLAKLSSGLRINKAGDDAAGLAISEKMRGQIRGLNQASRNAEDAISMIQTAEGGLNEVHDILQRMRELAVQASNSTMETADRTAIGDELLELKEEIDRISDNTEFNGKNLLNGSLSTSVSSSSTILEGTLINTATTGIAISDLDVSGAAASTTYTLDVGTTSGVIRLESTEGTQSITLTDGLEDNTPETLSFGELGISIEIVRVGTGYDSAASLVAALDGKVINTATGDGAASFAIGANEGQEMTVAFNDMGSDQIGTGAGNMISDLVASDQCVDSVADAQTLITAVDDAIEDIATQRGIFGAAQNRLEHTIKNLDTSAENLQASESRIRDVDMAKEMMEFTKNNILVQAAQSMLSQANQQPQGVLGLLR